MFCSPGKYPWQKIWGREIGGDITEALEAYDLKPALWPKDTDFVRELATL